MKGLQSVLLSLMSIAVGLSQTASGYPFLGPDGHSAATSLVAPTLEVRAASGDLLPFQPPAPPSSSASQSTRRLIPRLVLRRNGALTDPDERTLSVEVTGLEVPFPGVTVALTLETQHRDPDASPRLASAGQGLQSASRIVAWQAARFVRNPSPSAPITATVVFTHTFEGTVAAGAERIATPTDYFRYELVLLRSAGPGSGSSSASVGAIGTIHRVEQDYAFLMENQWVTDLPNVMEASEGAAPDQLVVYYLDMVPFRKNQLNPETWVPRDEVSAYVGGELVPRMADAFRLQTDVWGFTWYDAWTSYRSGADRERLSVALTDGHTWFHGRAPRRAHSGISLRVTAGDNIGYVTLTDGIMSSFHHELFHNHQRNISQHLGGDGRISGAGGAFRFITEGTAVLASSVAQGDVQFESTARAYAAAANSFVNNGALLTNDLNTSYAEMDPYHAAIYWRFVYEQCGRVEDGTFDPARGMHLIRRALAVLYAGEVVDVASTTDLVRVLPAVMNRALAGTSCGFDTYEESLVAFARAIHALRLEGGRCGASGSPEGCGFYDPHRIYSEPSVARVRFEGSEMGYVGEIPSSYGIDFVEVVLDSPVDDRTVTIEVRAQPSGHADFAVETWDLRRRLEGARLPSAFAPRAKPTASSTLDSSEPLSVRVTDVRARNLNRIALIITRLDAKEHLDPVGQYTILIRSDLIHSDLIRSGLIRSDQPGLARTLSPKP